MKRSNILHYLLEIIVILGFLVIGVTVLTYIFQGEQMNLQMDHIFIGSIILSMGVIEFTDYSTWRYAVKIKSVQSLVSAVITIALGIVFIVINFEMELLCILFGAFSISFAIAKIVTASLNLTRQPLLNGIKIILSIIEIVLSILLIIRTTSSLRAHMIFIGIALIVEAFVLIIEFMVHRYQRI